MDDFFKQHLPIILLYVAIFAGMYFFMIRPQSKRKKAEESMRNNLKVGDEITTIGGIIGKVVNIKEDSDSIVIETSIDRSKVWIRRWAIATTKPAISNSVPESKE